MHYSSNNNTKVAMLHRVISTSTPICHALIDVPLLCMSHRIMSANDHIRTFLRVISADGMLILKCLIMSFHPCLLLAPLFRLFFRFRLKSRRAALIRSFLHFLHQKGNLRKFIVILRNLRMTGLLLFTDWRESYKSCICSSWMDPFFFSNSSQQTSTPL